MSEDREQDLIEAARQGDRDAFGALVDMHKQTIFHVCLSHVRNEDEAMDLVQDTFLKAFTRLETFRPGSNFRAWMCRIAANGSIDKLRRRKTWRSTEIDDRLDASTFNEGRAPAVSSWGRTTPMEEASQNELGQRLMAALDELPESMRQCVLLCDVQGYSYAEIAEELDIPKGTVMSRLFYARKRLQEMLQEFREEASNG